MRRQRKDIHMKYGGRCAYCGKVIAYEEMQVDHIIPLRKGGPDDSSNYAPACRTCNHYKSTLTLEQFRQQLEKIQSRLKDVYIYRLALQYGLVKECRNKVEFYFEKAERMKQHD